MSLLEQYQEYPQLILDPFDSYKCSLCHKLMLKPCYLKCFCQYCFKCINKYINDGNTKCTTVEDCAKFTLVSDDIKENEFIKGKIFNLKVKCYNKNCCHEDELKKIEKHLENCDKVGLKCPLFDINCRTQVSDDEQLTAHLIKEQKKHLNLLVENINRSREEDSRNNNTAQSINERINTMKDEFTTKVDDFAKEINVPRDRLNKFEEWRKISEDDIKDYRTRTKERMELEAKKIRDLERCLDEEKKKTACLSNKISNQKKKFKTMMTDINNEFDNKLQVVIAKQESDINKLVDEVAELNNRLDKNPVNSKDIPLVNFCPFQWVIDDWPTKVRNQDRVNKLLSDVFYSNRGEYKMRIGIIFKSSLNFKFCVQILKGDHDDQLSWPCRFKIQIEVMKNDGEGSCKSAKIEINQYQPKTEEKPMKIDETSVSTGDIDGGALGQDDSVTIMIYKTE